MTTATVSRQWLNAILETSSLYQKALDTSGLDIPEHGRIALDTMVDLWVLATKASKDPFFGLKVGLNLRLGHLNVVGHVFSTASNLAEAFEQVTRYSRLISDGGQLSIESSPNYSTITYTPLHDTKPFIYHQIDAVIAAIISQARWLSGSELKDIEIHLQHENKSSERSGILKKYETYLNAHVKIGKKENAIIFPNYIMEKPIFGGDPELHKHQDQLAKQLLNALPSESLKDTIQQLLTAQLEQGVTTKEQVSEQLNINAKRLQRKLREEGTTFQTLLDQIRFKLAMQHLENKESIQNIAILLGFSEASAFIRAFKRWTNGTSPKQYSVSTIEP